MRFQISNLTGSKITDQTFSVNLNVTRKPTLTKLNKADYRNSNGTKLLLKKEENLKKAVSLTFNPKRVRPKAQSIQEGFQFFQNLYLSKRKTMKRLSKGKCVQYKNKLRKKMSLSLKIH